MALPKTVIDLIKEVSRKYPDSPALKFKNSYLSYKELEEKSDELAFQLLQNGLNLEDKVVVFLPLSFELVISTYAILKAGGCYVPLSLKDGKDRFINIMEELECNIILGNSETLSSRIPLTSAKLFDLNLSKKNWIESVGAQVSPKMPVSFPEIAPGNLSYLLYTSGTTGRPKGAMMEHGNLYSYMLALQKIYPIGRESRILQNPNNVFDSSIITMFTSLIQGAILVLWEGDLYDVLAEEKITDLVVTPPHASLIDPKRYPHLKTICVGGEKCPEEFITRFTPYLKLFNIYGPAECTATVTWTLLNGLEKPHIGDVVPGSSVYLVDSKGNQVPQGTPGELWVGGDLVGRGYLKRPELTAEKYIPNPFGEGRIYKTGDLVCWDKNGHLDFLGRIDRQIKVRGFRIELDGIETQINRFPGITGCVVKVFNDNLVAFVTPQDTKIDALNSFLKDQLPAWAVPHKIVPLEFFTPGRTGKIDTSLLLNPFENVNRNGHPPTTREEKMMAELWASIIFKQDEKTPIYLNDNFFDLGGNSLHVMKLMGKLRKALNNPKIPQELLYHNADLKSFCHAAKVCAENTNEEERIKVGLQDILDFTKVLPTVFLDGAATFLNPLLLLSLCFIHPIFIIIYPIELLLNRSERIFSPKLKLKLGWRLEKNVEVEEEAFLENLEAKLICVHPHGLTSAHCKNLTDYLHKKNVNYRTTLDAWNFDLPLNYTFNLFKGFVPASEKTYHWAKNKGISLFVTPGDTPEYWETHKPNTMVLRPNKSFFKVALKTGMPLVPVYVYNVHETFKVYPNLLKIRNSNKWLKAILDIHFYRGKFGLPIPFNRNQRYAIGKSIQIEKVDNPTWAQVEGLVERYSKAYSDLFERFKPKGYATLKIL